MTEKATRLYPLPPREIPTDAIYEDLELPPAERQDPSRPYVIINMVSSVDGKTAVHGKSAGMGSHTDRRTMRTLRSRADAVMIGANTLRAEKLSLGLDAPDQGRQPLAVIVTGSGDAPLESNLMLGEGQELLLITPPHTTVRVPEGAGRALSTPAREDGSINLREALKFLKTEHAVDLLLVEGGPTLNHSLISENLVDELFVTLAPRLVGGPSVGILSENPGPTARDVALLCAHLAENELFLRYALRA